MRIGIDARMFGRFTGGVGRYAREIILNLAKIDEKNLYYVFIPKSESEDWTTAAKNFKKIEVDFVHYGLKEQTEFLSLLNYYDLDLMHFTNFNHPIFYRRPFVITIHDLTMTKFPVGRKQNSALRKWAYNFVMKSAAKNSRFVITESNSSKKDILGLLGMKEEKIKITPLGVDKTFKQKSRREKEIKKILNKYNIKKPYLLFVSQWRPHKGIKKLVRSFEILKQEYRKDNLNLVIPGKPNDHFPDILQTITKSKFKKDIITPGFIDDNDLPLIYNEALVFVFPSLYEGFGLNPVEAMAAGTVVAASNVSCMPEVLGRAALYFDPRDEKDIALKVNTLIENNKLRDKLILRGFKQAEKYSWEKTAKQTLQIYKEAVRHRIKN